MSAIPIAESPLAGTAVAAVLADRAAEHMHEPEREAEPTAATAPAEAPVRTALRDSCTSSVHSHRTPAIEVIAIHREAPVVSPTSFSAHYEAAVQRLSGHTSPHREGATSESRDSDEVGADIPIDAVEVEETVDEVVTVATAQFALPTSVEEASSESADGEVAQALEAEDVHAAYEVASDSPSEPALVNNGIDGTEAQTAQQAAERDVSGDAPAADGEARPSVVASATRASGGASQGVGNVEEIPIHESDGTQFVLVRQRRSSASASGSASSPPRPSGSTAAGERHESGSRHDSPLRISATRLPRGQQPEVLSHPFVLVRRSSNSDDTNSRVVPYSSREGTLVGLSGQNSVGSSTDVVNGDDSAFHRLSVPSASPAASPQFKLQLQQRRLPSPSSQVATRTAPEGRIVRGPAAQQPPTRGRALPEDATSPGPSTQPTAAGGDASGRRRLGSVSVVEVDQAADRLADATKPDASQEAIKLSIYVLLEQHGSTVRVWEDRIRTAEVYRDRPLRTGGRPDPLRASDIGFLERAARTLDVHHNQLTEARQLLETQIHLPSQQRAQPNLVVRNDPRSPLAPAAQEAAWEAYCQRFHGSLDDLLVQTDYLQHRVDALLNPPSSTTTTTRSAAPARRTGHSPSRGSSRASSAPATPRGQTGRQPEASPSRRSLQPPPPAKDFTWHIPTRATSRRRRGSTTVSEVGSRSVTPRGRVTSRPVSRPSSPQSTPRGHQSRTAEATAAASSSPPPRIGRPSHGGSPSRLTRASVQRGSQSITPAHRTAPSATATAASSSAPRMGISEYDRSTPYGQLPGTPRKQRLSEASAPRDTSPSSAATSTVSREGRTALVTQLAALEARGDSLQRDDLARARAIFTDLYGPDAGLKQYCSWVDGLALKALQST